MAYSNIRGTPGPNAAKSEVQVQKRPETHRFPRMALTRAVQRVQWTTLIPFASLERSTGTLVSYKEYR
jgi:hypothetical protein